MGRQRAPTGRTGPPRALVDPGPLPNNPLRYVLVYLFELDNGVAMVDAGWNTEESWAALNDGIGQAGGSIGDVNAVVVTHIHPDHYGLAGRVREASGHGSGSIPPTPRSWWSATRTPTT